VQVSNGAQLDLDIYSGTVGAVTLIDGAISGTDPSTLTGSTFDVRKGTISVSLAGATLSAGLTKTTAGTVTLTGTNSYSGGTVVKGGTLEIGSTGALPSGMALTIDTNAAGAAGASAVPEPGTIALLAAALATLAVAGWRRRK